MLEVAERDGEAAMHRTSHAPLVTQVRTSAIVFSIAPVGL
jgi:hypothetical protein